MRAMETPNVRPSPWIRIAVVVVALTSLGLVMCHSERRANPPRPAEAQQQAATPDAPPAKAEKMEKHEDYFPATKAPGRW